jgi:hypothetical protein
VLSTQEKTVVAQGEVHLRHVRAVTNVIQFKTYWAEVRSCFVVANELYYSMLCSKLLDLCVVLLLGLLLTQHLANGVQWEVIDSVMETYVFDRVICFL